MPFTPVESSVGGILIGVSCALALVVHGKIGSCAGIIGPFCRTVLLGGDNKWRALFLIGFPVGGIVNMYLNHDLPFAEALPLSWVEYAIAPLASGVGTRLGNGCTSGHGMCGLARLSVRSLVAVCTFMGCAGVTVYITQHVLKHTPGPRFAPMAEIPTSPLSYTYVSFAVSLVLAALAIFVPTVAPVMAGLIFSLGLGCSGMISQEKVIGFLDVFGTWDPSLALVMGCGLAITVPAFAWSRRDGAKPRVTTCEFEKSNKTGLDWQLLAGMVLFGVGWGLGGICPGPGLAATVPHVMRDWPWGYGMRFALYMPLFCLSWLATDRLLARFSDQPSADQPPKSYKQLLPT